MTEQPEDDYDPTAEELYVVTAGFADSRRLLAAAEAKDYPAMEAIIAGIEATGQGSAVLLATVRACLDFGRVLEAADGLIDENGQVITLGMWLSLSGLLQLDRLNELDGDDE